MYDQAYIQYLVQFHGPRDYFECHEILEEHWKKEEPNERQIVWVGLIQIAVALYHQRRGNYTGAYKMLQSAIRILEKDKDKLEQLGLDSKELLSQLLTRLSEIEKNTAYKSLNLPITDPHLLELCKRACEDHNWTWCSASDVNDLNLIHKHTRRDRTEVITERTEAIRRKKMNL